MALKQVVGISDFSGINRVGVDSSGRLLVNLGGASVTVDISGDPVSISGQTVLLTSASITRTIIVQGGTDSASIYPADESVDNAASALLTANILYGHEQVVNAPRRVRVTASGQGVSGINHKVVVAFSGDTTTSIAIASPQAIIRTASGVKCTSLSGGVAFPSLAGDRIIVKANQDNSGRIYLGSTTNPPFSGMGLQLAAGQSESFAVTNTNVFQAFASASGDVVSVIVEDV